MSGKCGTGGESYTTRLEITPSNVHGVTLVVFSDWMRCIPLFVVVCHYGAPGCSSAHATTAATMGLVRGDVQTHIHTTIDTSVHTADVYSRKSIYTHAHTLMCSRTTTADQTN